jgi:hypothetical protein
MQEVVVAKDFARPRQAPVGHSEIEFNRANAAVL